MNIPDVCYSLNNMTINPKTEIGSIIRIQALEKGYYETGLQGTQEEVNKMNRELGVNITTANAMETASMFGWDTYLDVLASYKKSERNKANKEKK